jgi:acyl-CoA synthetase (AMP-forming)/AMP-acid ligase II
MQDHWVGRGRGEALVTSGGERLDHAALALAARRVASSLREAGAGPGRVVAVHVEAPGPALVAMLGVLESGAALLPLDARLGASGLADTLARARPLVVVDGATLDGEVGFVAPSGNGSATPARTLSPEAGLLLFTSGSSGEPKGVVLDARAIAANVDAILGYLPVAEHPRTAITLPLSYSYALVGQALTTLRAGGTVILLGDVPFPAVQLEALVRFEATGLSSVPTQLRWLARAAGQATARPRLGYVASAGAALDAGTRSLLAETFPGARRFNQYGLTEACPRVTAIADDDPRFEAGSVGRPLPGLSVVAVDEAGEALPPGAVGELAVAGPSVMRGYLDDPDGTARAFCGHGLRTGDVGHVDAAGYVWVAGRRDGLVKCGGERVSVEEVAAVVRRAPGVHDAAVVAVPDVTLGSRLVAYVEASEPDTVARVGEAARTHLPAAKRPHRVVALRELPRGPHGKIDLAALRGMAEAP